MNALMIWMDSMWDVLLVCVRFLHELLAYCTSVFHLPYVLMKGVFDSTRSASSESGGGHRVPQHLGVLVNHRSAICIVSRMGRCNRDVGLQRAIADIVLYSTVHGVHKVTVYDPWSLLLADIDAITANVENRLAMYGVKRTVVVKAGGRGYAKDSGGNQRHTMQVAVLGREHGRRALVEICKTMCRDVDASQSSCTREMISCALAAWGITEPDCILQIGGLPSMAGYPPWAMRCSEIVPVETAGWKGGVTAKRFREFIKQFAEREQRCGR